MAVKDLRLALSLVALFMLVPLAGCVSEAEAPPTHFPAIQVDGVYAYDGQDYRVGADWDGVDRYLQDRTLLAFYPDDTSDLSELENGTHLYDSGTRDKLWRATPPTHYPVTDHVGEEWDPLLMLVQLSGQPLDGTPTGATFLHDLPATLEIGALSPGKEAGTWVLNGTFHTGEVAGYVRHQRFTVAFAEDGSWFVTNWHTPGNSDEIVRVAEGVGPLPAPSVPDWPRTASGVERGPLTRLDSDAGPCSPLLTIRELAEHPLVAGDLERWFAEHEDAELVSYEYRRGGTPFGRYNDRPDHHRIDVVWADGAGDGFEVTGAQYTGKAGEPEMPIDLIDWKLVSVDPAGPSRDMVPIGDLFCLDRAWAENEEPPVYVTWERREGNTTRVYFEYSGEDAPNRFVAFNGCTGAVEGRAVGGDAIVDIFIRDVPCWQRIDT